MQPTETGWYWYRSSTEFDPASSGDWVALEFDAEQQRVMVADTSAALGDMTGEWRGPIQEPDDARLRDVICPQCGQPFELTWNDHTRDELDRYSKKQTLFMRGCPSGGIYDVSISCPHCDYEEEL